MSMNKYELDSLISAAECGDMDAQFKLACYYYRHRKSELCRYWLEMAAEQGSIEAYEMIIELGSSHIAREEDDDDDDDLFDLL